MLWPLGALGLTGGGIGVAALLGGGPWMLMAGKGALAFIRALNPWQLLLIAAILIAGVQTLRLKMEQRTDAKLTAQLSKTVAARQADRDAYAKAQADAQAKNLADIQRTEQRQKEISDARVADLNSRLQRIARELRDNPSAKGSAGRTPIPATGQAPCRAIDPAWLCLSPADRLLAAQNEERQDQLISWVIGQENVDPNQR